MDKENVNFPDHYKSMLEGKWKPVTLTLSGGNFERLRKRCQKLLKIGQIFKGTINSAMKHFSLIWKSHRKCKENYLACSFWKFNIEINIQKSISVISQD